MFAAIGLESVKDIGIGCAVTIGIDATLVRLILVPAMMATAAIGSRPAAIRATNAASFRATSFRRRA